MGFALVARMITNEGDLAALCARAKEVGFVALDTEFVWERTYYPAMGVVQVGVGKDECRVVDATKTDHLAPLGELLADPSVVKILHDAEQDLTLLRRLTGASPRNVFDTQLAAAVVGMPYSVSLRNLVRTVAGVDLAKTETQSDWLKRPLSEEQMRYAEDDVRYLPLVRERLLRRAERKGRAHWMVEEMASYDDPALYEERDPAEAFLRMKGLQRFSHAQRGVAKALCAWREKLARRVDRPRHFLVNDDVMATIILKHPSTLVELAAIKGLPEKVLKRNGNEILDVLDAAKPHTETLPGDVRANDEEVVSARAELVYAYMKALSLAADLDPVFVAPKAAVRELVLNGPAGGDGAARLVSGWRAGFLGEGILAFVRGEAAIALDPANGWPCMRPISKVEA